MMIFEVGGSWTANRMPQILEDYPHPGIVSCNDVSGAYPPIDPNIGVWQCRAEQTIVDAIDADNNYWVFWSEVEDET